MNSDDMMSNDRDRETADLRDLLVRRAEVSADEVDAMRSFVRTLPTRRRRIRRGLLTAAASIAAVVCLGGGAYVFMGGQVRHQLGALPHEYLKMPSLSGADVACSTTDPAGNPAGCVVPTPLPTYEPASLAASVPLKVASLDLPLTLGPQTIYVGQATIANGVLREATFSIADIPDGVVGVQPSGFTVADAITLEVRPADAKRPDFTGPLARGWHPGTEVVKVYLVFDVTSVQAGATLQIRNLVVR